MSVYFNNFGSHLEDINKGSQLVTKLRIILSCLCKYVSLASMSLFEPLHTVAANIQSNSSEENIEAVLVSSIWTKMKTLQDFLWFAGCYQKFIKAVHRLQLPFLLKRYLTWTLAY